MIIFRSFVPNPQEDDRETHVGYFVSEELAKTVSGKEYQLDSFIVEPIQVIETEEEFFDLKKELEVQDILRSVPEEKRKLLIEHLTRQVVKRMRLEKP